MKKRDYHFDIPLYVVVSPHPGKDGRDVFYAACVQFDEDTTHGIGDTGEDALADLMRSIASRVERDGYKDTSHVFFRPSDERILSMFAEGEDFDPSGTYRYCTASDGDTYDIYVDRVRRWSP